jgi:hypothetical protein
MSQTPHPTDVEVSRCLNALVTTLNDWRVERPDERELQALVTGALGGEPRIRVRHATAAETIELTDGEGTVLARVARVDGRWDGERVGAPLSGGYVPSAGGAEA